MRKVYLEEVDSTNKWAKEHINELDNMSVIYTYKQTSGRGRLKRKWNYTGEDNIYASIVIKPQTGMKDIYSNLTQLLCIILADVFEEYNITPKIKWPNDIRVNKKKISGILAETVLNKEGNISIILGFGVNLNCEINDMNKIDQPATSLNIEIGMTIDKEIFLNKVLEKFCLMYDSFIGEGFLLIRDNYIRRAEFLGEEIKVQVFDKQIEGTAVDITENGALKIIDKNNTEQILLIGDIL